MAHAQVTHEFQITCLKGAVDFVNPSVLEFNGFGAYSTFNEEENVAVSPFTQPDEHRLSAKQPYFLSRY